MRGRSLTISVRSSTWVPASRPGPVTTGLEAARSVPHSFLMKLNEERAGPIVRHPPQAGRSPAESTAGAIHAWTWRPHRVPSRPSSTSIVSASMPISTPSMRTPGDARAGSAIQSRRPPWTSRRDRRATTTSLGPVRSLAHRGVGRPLHRLMDVVLLVKPETVVGWHRAAWRLIWRWRSQRPPGRPRSMRISANSSGGCGASPTWGQQIIAAELAKLGYQVSPRTVAKYRPSDLDRQRGQQVQQILATFQMEALGGGGYLRLVRFSSAERRVTDRSDLFAISGQVQNDPDNNFTLDY